MFSDWGYVFLRWKDSFVFNGHNILIRLHWTLFGSMISGFYFHHCFSFLFKDPNLRKKLIAPVFFNPISIRGE